MGLEVPKSLGRLTGRNVGVWGGWGGIVPPGEKEGFELLNCGPLWVEVQAGFLSYSAEVKLKANPAPKWWASSFTPLIFAECTSVECEVHQSIILCPFSLVWITAQVAGKQNVGSNRCLKTAVFLKNRAEADLCGEELMFAEFLNKFEPSFRDWKPSGFSQFPP